MRNNTIAGLLNDWQEKVPLCTSSNAPAGNESPISSEDRGALNPRRGRSFELLSRRGQESVGGSLTLHQRGRKCRPMTLACTPRSLGGALTLSVAFLNAPRS